MEKLTVVGNFLKYVEYLRNTECSQREKVHHFQHISDCLASPSMISNEHFGKHVSSGINVLLLFCEDLDSVVRMSAEENLNKVIRSVENTRLSRVLLDLYNEIKKNGNQKSLRICLNLFAYYSPRMKEKNVKWYALKLLPCLQVIAQREETLLIETLADFVKSFSQHMQNCLNDNENLKLMEIFLADIISDCAVKRRCSAQSCVNLIKGARRHKSMAKDALSKALDFLRSDLSTNKIIGVLGFLRLLCPLIISYSEHENKQIIEIYDFCLYLLNNCNHSIINASLEVINAILTNLSTSLKELLLSNDLHQNDFLKKRKSLKNQIFQLKNAEMTCSDSTSMPSTMAPLTSSEREGSMAAGVGLNQQHAHGKSSSETIKDAFKSGKTTQVGGDRADEQFSRESDAVHGKRAHPGQDPSSLTNRITVDDEPTTMQVSSTPTEFCRVIVDNVDNVSDYTGTTYANKMTSSSATLPTSIMPATKISEPQEDTHLHSIDDKLQILSDVDNESFNSIDFESEITIGIGNDGIDYELQKDKVDADSRSIQSNKETRQKTKDAEKADTKSLKSSDSIGAVFNNFLSHPNTATVNKLFRTLSKSSGLITEQSSPTISIIGRSKTKRTVEVKDLESKSQLSQKQTASIDGSNLGMGLLNLDDDTISLESLSSHISLSSYVSQQSRNEHDSMLAPCNDSEIERIFGVTVAHDEQGETLKNVQLEPLDGISSKTREKSTLQSGVARSPTILPDAPFQSPRKVDSSNSGRFNPFDDSTVVAVKIGTLHEQNILYYTTRLVVSNFLLGGTAGNLVSDSLIRVSIKSLSLAVIANCVEIRPEILYLPLEIGKFESALLDMSPDISTDNSSESILTHEVYTEHQSDELLTENPNPSIPVEDGFLEIKDDHFGVNTNPFLFDYNLSKSVDESLLSQLHKSNLENQLETKQRDESRLKLNSQLQHILTKSEIIQTPSSKNRNVKSRFDGRQNPSLSSIPTQNVCPLNMPIVLDLKLGQNNKKSGKERKESQEVNSKQSMESDGHADETFYMNSTNTIQAHHNRNRDHEEEQYDGTKQQQFIYEIFLYCNHTDPILRGNMQIIACNFAKACLDNLLRVPAVREPLNTVRVEHPEKQLLLNGPFDIQKLLKILIKGLRDDIHTVVIQALTSFDKMFPLLMKNWYMEYAQDIHYNESFKNAKDIPFMDSLFDNILEQNQKAQISPKLLLNQLQFCFANKYWLVQNKYADVISNLDLSIIRDYYNDDIAVQYEQIFLEQLWQLLGDDDVRVRDHAAICICNFIRYEKGEGKHIEMNTEDDNDRKIIDEFLKQRVFRGMSQTLCDVLNKGRVMNPDSCNLLARTLYIMTNRLMDLDKKNVQFGIINAIRVFLNEFNPIDHLHIWNEFNLIELCLCFMLQNLTTSIDINIQIGLIEINTKLISANLLVGTLTSTSPVVENLFEHVMLILRIYCQIFSNLKAPTTSLKSLKTDVIFINSKETTSFNAEEVSRDHLYLKLYGILKTAFDNYKISINHESGNKLMSLAASCLNALAVLLEFKQNTNAPNSSVKLIEEALEYLTVIVNYLPIETINCLRQLLKFLFCRNYGNRKVEYENFLKLYFAIRNPEREESSLDCKPDKVATGVKPEGVNECEHGKDEHEACNRSELGIAQQSHRNWRMRDDKKDFLGSSGDRFNLSELFASAISFPLSKSKLEEDCTKHIKLFEPLVIYCLTLFMKSNALVQTTILDMLTDLLDFNVTYSILDSKNIIFEQVEHNIQLIENGSTRNIDQLIRSTIRFLVKLTRQSDKKLISIAKIISIINNLFISNTLQEYSVIALKELAFDIFFKHPKLLSHRSNVSPSIKERNAEREVVLGMLEKYVSSIECQKMLALLMLWARTVQTKVSSSDPPTSTFPSPAAADDISVTTTSVSGASSVEQQPSTIVEERAILSIVIGALQNGRIIVNDCETYFVLNSIFRNCDKSILLGSDLFESLLGLFIERHAENFNDLSFAVIFLDNIILKTEQIYLENHVKLLFMKNSIKLDTSVEGETELNIASTENRERKLLQPELDKKFVSRLAGDPGSGGSLSSLNEAEINYFVKVLYSILETCFSTSMANPCDTSYKYLTSKYISLVAKVGAKFDKMGGYLRILHSQNNIMFEKLDTISKSLDELKVDILTLICELYVGREESSSSSMKSSTFCLKLQPRSILQCIQKVNTKYRQEVLSRVCEKFNSIDGWMAEDIKILVSSEILETFLKVDTPLKSAIMKHAVFSCVFIEQLLTLPIIFCQNKITSIVELIWKINLNASFLKLKFLWRLFIDKNSTINRSSEKLIQLHFNNEVQALESRLLLGDCKVHCSRNNEAIVILKEISNGGNGEHLNKLSLSVQNTLQRLLRLFTNEEWLRDKDDGAGTTTGCWYERLDEGKVCEFQKEINEKWLMQQVVEISNRSDCEALAKVLMDFKSEIKLKTIFNATDFNSKDIFGPCLDISFHTMITSFQNNCVQYNPHINYMNVNPLLRVTLQSVLRNLKDAIEKGCTKEDVRLLSRPILSLMKNLEKLEAISLLYIKSTAIQKFIHDQLLKAEPSIAELFIQFAALLAQNLKDTFNEKYPVNVKDVQIEIQIYLACLDAIIKQKFVWAELNQPQKYERHLNTILDMLFEGMTKSIRNTIFYRMYWLQQNDESHQSDSDEIGKNYSALGYVDMSNNAENDDKDANGICDSETRTLRVRKAIFLGKMVETSMDRYDNKIHVKFINSRQLMKYMNSTAISLLRTNYYYGLAVVPYELFRTFSYDKQMSTYSKLPSIPVDHLSDVEILLKFIRRLSIFGFSTRQQFEEYFMTFLLLINRTYDVNMVDEQEQFLIKNACLTVIVELLIMCRTFPSVGNKLSKFQHTTRWPRIKCRNSISLKKLHKIQLIIPGSNVFYHPNLERDLCPIRHDSIIGTHYFLPNQYELNHVWQQMEAISNEPLSINSDGGSALGVGSIGASGEGGGIGISDIDGIKDYTAGIDLKSSSQLIFDVFTQIIEYNHVLVLPNLVKFCEICDNREHIRWIKNTVMKLQEQIPFDDTISHQYIIYLLCRTQSILVPSFSELSHLCSIISTYLKSTHIFIRNATLHGLLCLLECCTKTSTTMGKLSEELCLLREIIVGYITHHGIVEESSTIFSETHIKLVWTLNFSLIEMTSKFVPDCHLLSNTIISANNLLKRTTDEAVYLCIIHGLERIMVVTTAPKPICDKVEKLALELVRVENERFSLPALKLLLSCVYMGSSKQLETTEHSNGIVQDDPEIIAQQTEKVDVLLHRIKSSTSSAARIYGEVLCQIVRDLVPPNEILTKVIKEFLAINQPHCEVIARIVYQVFRSCIDSSYLRMLQDWLICSLPNFFTLPIENSVWCLTIIFLSASINLDLIKLFPFALHNSKKFDDIEILLFMISARDFYIKLNAEQKTRFREIFKDCEQDIYKDMLKCI